MSNFFFLLKRFLEHSTNMIKLYFKQAFFQLRENRLISLVSIIGTALAICMIMVIVLVLEVRITDCVPEVNRSRSLYMKAMSIHQKGDTSDNSSKRLYVTYGG